MRNLRSATLASVALLASAGDVSSFQAPEQPSRLEARGLPDPGLATDVAPRALEGLPPTHALRAGWERFAAEQRGSWHVHLDGRSGAPLAVVGEGLDWPVRAPEGWSKDEGSWSLLEASLRAFAAEHRELLLAKDDELVLDREASGPVGPHAWRAVFGHEVRGIPVEGDRYLFTFGYGRLVLFGASRWTPVAVETTPTLSPARATEVLLAYVGGEAKRLSPPSLRIVPQRSEGGEPGSGAFVGQIGRGYTSALVWRIVLVVDGEPGTWVGMVDAHAGRVLAFFDDDRYAQVKGGVHPESADGLCPSGCEQPGFPMPYAQVTINASPVTGNALGTFSCVPAGAVASTALQSSTVRISDTCGVVNEAAACGNDVDLSANPGPNCVVPAGHSAGDTRAARTSFYVVNRLKEHARSWLPANAWLTSVQTQVNTNVNATCNALWSAATGTLSLYREGGGCRNTGELAGVIQHEWAHGLDSNDGGPATSPGEGYADIVELLADHTSCIGRGFYLSQNCSGYGNPCLACTGIRDMDWDARQGHAPTTLTSASASCPTGGQLGPCNRTAHCETYVVGETVWDLAVRDLPAAGMDQASAWQLVDRLWYQSRQGANGNMYQCAAGSGGCVASSLYYALLVADDDNGNIVDGTPHMAAIFNPFNRHGIACNAPSVQNTGGAAVATGLSLSAAASSNAIGLSWTATPVAPDPPASYRVLRSDLSCTSSFTTVAAVPAPTTSFTDSGLPNGSPLYYRVQAVGSNAAHESALSNCVAAAAAATAKPVAQLTASRTDATTLGVIWDVATCTSPDYEILYGSLSALPGYTISGSVCGIGTSGSTTWSGAPAGNLWFVVTGVSGSGTEASWGLASSGHRNGATPSNQCGSSARNNGPTCP